MTQKQKGKIKALIFDIGGVLQLGDNSSLHHKKIISKSGVHPDMARKLNVSLDQYLDAIDTAYASSIEGKISEKKALGIMAKNLKTTPKKLQKLYIQSYKKHFTLNKKLLNYAIKKKQKEYKIAIISDQWWLSKKALITKKFSRFFNPLIISCEVGLRKPNPKIYRLILKRLRLKPSETVFIDNQPWNLVPAKKLGMKTVLFRNNKQTIRDLNKILK